MKRERHTEEQIIAILKEHEAGLKTADLCRKHGISEASFYNWKAKYGGLKVSKAKRHVGETGRAPRDGPIQGTHQLGGCGLTRYAMLLIAVAIFEEPAMRQGRRAGNASRIFE
jgi:hypothetical protein